MIHEIFTNFPNLEVEFRSNCRQQYTATEIAYIMRFLNGEKDLKGSFSEDNLYLVKSLLDNKIYIEMKTTYQSNDWNEIDFNTVYDGLKKYFGGKFWINHRNEKIFIPKTKNGIESIFGLPYTSTSICPMLSLDCNVNIFDPENKGHHFSHVVLNIEKHVVLVLIDNEENEKIIII